MLHEADTLSHFYTDICAVKGRPRLLGAMRMHCGHGLNMLCWARCQRYTREEHYGLYGALVSILTWGEIQPVPPQNDEFTIVGG